jgi:superfamily I DNA/RNA helicase
MSWWLDITDLDEDQKEVIRLPAVGNYLIAGPPGSGKTNLLLIRAEYLIRAGQPNVVVLMFNDPLHSFVVGGGVNYDVPSSKIRKMLSWEIVLLRENGVPVDDFPEDDLPEKRKALAVKVHQLLDAVPQLQGHLKCLLVDEVQDCLDEEIEAFFRCAENVCFAGDDRQRLFNAQNVMAGLRGRAGLTTIDLTTHYRIGHEICRAADAVGKAAGLDPVENSCNYRGAMSSVKFIECTDDEAQAAQIIATLGAQLTAYPDEMLAVAAPRKADRDFLRGRMEASPLAPNLLPHRACGTDDPAQRIYVANLMEIKGLEFRAVHLGMMQHLHRLGENQKRIAYTAITRAKTSLCVYFWGKIPGYLEQAQATIEPPKPLPDLADLFPRNAKRAVE